MHHKIQSQAMSFHRVEQAIVSGKIFCCLCLCLAWGWEWQVVIISLSCRLTGSHTWRVLGLHVLWSQQVRPSWKSHPCSTRAGFPILHLIRQDIMFLVRKRVRSLEGTSFSKWGTSRSHKKLTLASSEVWWGEGRQDNWKPPAATYHTQKWPTSNCKTNQSQIIIFTLPPTTPRSGHSLTAKLINRIVIAKSVLTPTNTTQKLPTSSA